MGKLAEKIRAWGPSPCTVSDAWLVLQTLPGVRPERLARLIEAYPTPLEALAAPASDFARLAGRKAQEILAKESPVDLAARIRREAERGGASVLARGEPAFPESLENIFAPPGALFVEGALRAEDRLAVSIVGTRRPTDYGVRMAREIAGALASRGITIVSGLAYGIDAEAHRAALEAGGRTVAVLGCGLGNQYPAEHKDLRAAIAASGAVLSELAWMHPPRPENFPRRNRLISGLSAATVVIEAAHRSGALLTARLALEQGREVMALPGPVHTGRSAGCHRLIKEGAQLVESAEDVLEALPGYFREDLGWREPRPAPGRHTKEETGPGAPSAAPAPNLSEEERALLRLLEGGENSLEGLTRAGGLPPEAVAGALLRLELQGLVRKTHGGLYARA